MAASLVWRGRIGVKASNASRLKQELNRIDSSSDARPIYEILQFITERLPARPAFKWLADKPVRAVVTDYYRGDEPKFASFDDFAKETKLSIDAVRSVFGNRPEEMVSEQEWIYRFEIAKDPKNWKPRKSVHSSWRAIDLRTSGGGETIMSCQNGQADDVKAAIINEFASTPGFAGLFIKIHAIAGGGEHMHLQIGGLPEDHIPISKLEFPMRDWTRITDNPDLKQKEYSNYLVNTDMAEMETSETQQGEFVDSAPEGHTLRVGKDGLIETLVIGDLDFLVCPVTQISFSQSAQVSRFETIRTKGDPKIAMSSAPSSVSISLIFPNVEQINNSLRPLIAQFIMTPITKVQNRFISRTMKSFEVDHEGKTTENKFKTAEDERLWMTLNSINVKSIQGLPDSYEATITMDRFEDRVFGGKLQFLVDKKDLAAKYAKKLHVFGSNILPPPYRELVSNVQSFTEMPHINLTDNPASSKLYRNYYQTLFKNLAKYVPDRDGILEVTYFDAEFDRETLRTRRKNIMENFTKSLENTSKLFMSSDSIAKSLQVNLGLGVILPSDLINQTATGLSIAFRQSGYYQLWQTFRGRRMQSLKDRLAIYDDVLKKYTQIYSQVGLDQKSLEISKEIFKGVIKLIGLLDIPATFLSEGESDSYAYIEQIAKNSDGKDILRELSIRLGAMLSDNGAVSGYNYYQGESITDDQKKTITNVRKILADMTTCFLSIMDESEGNIINTGEYLPFTIADGDRSMITGISFSMMNKMVPMQIIGWKTPTFQHLGRSDWMIGMNLHVKGDDTIRKLMYVLNKTSYISEWVQTHSPMQFYNLNTFLSITRGGGIFKTLGIKNIILSSVDITSIPGEVDCYNISLGFEQADLSLRNYENIKSLPYKQYDMLLLEIVPILKSINCDLNDKHYGKLLDIEALRKAFDQLLQDEFGTYYKLSTLYGILNDPERDFLDYYNYFKVAFNDPITGTTLSDKYQPLRKLIDREKQGEFYVPNVSIFNKSNDAQQNLLAIALKEYHKNLEDYWNGSQKKTRSMTSKKMAKEYAPSFNAAARGF